MDLEAGGPVSLSSGSFSTPSHSATSPLISEEADENDDGKKGTGGSSVMAVQVWSAVGCVNVCYLLFLSRAEKFLKYVAMSVPMSLCRTDLRVRRHCT